MSSRLDFFIDAVWLCCPRCDPGCGLDASCCSSDVWSGEAFNSCLPIPVEQDKQRIKGNETLGGGGARIHEQSQI